MSRLLRASTLLGLPVITLSGESPLEIKDVVFDTGTGGIAGFTLRKHGFLGGPVKEALAWDDVHGLGPDAVIVEDASVLVTAAERITSKGGDVLRSRIMTESGKDLGEVVEAIIETGTRAKVVGFEVQAAPGVRDSDDHHLLIPLADTTSISGQNVVVPDAAEHFMSDDLSGFGASVEAFHSSLGGTA